MKIQTNYLSIFKYFFNFQKAEQKEKEKRQRERLKSLEMARDRMHKAAW